MNMALGIIELAGLVCAIEAADAAVKSANVTLIGYEMAKGGGYTVIKLAGDVGAVNAAIDAAATAAAKVGRVVSQKVIARPHHEIDKLIFSSQDGRLNITPEIPAETAPPAEEPTVEDVAPDEEDAPEEKPKSRASKGKKGLNADDANNQ